MLVVIPARAGSKRVSNKALRRLGAHPLIAYTIASARSLYNARVIVASENDAILECARHYGADVWLRPTYTATDDAPDLTWLSLFVDEMVGLLETFALRRLTSPFLTASTIGRAWGDFLQVPEATGMRAMRPAQEHPNKQWRRKGTWMVPIIPASRWAEEQGVESWSSPTQNLARVYVQTAGLEILKAETIRAGSLTGDKLLPLFLDDEQGFDLNTVHDWWVAEQLILADAAVLPKVEQDPWVPHD